MIYKGKKLTQNTPVLNMSLKLNLCKLFACFICHTITLITEIHHPLPTTQETHAHTNTETKTNFNVYVYMYNGTDFCIVKQS